MFGWQNNLSNHHKHNPAAPVECFCNPGAIYICSSDWLTNLIHYCLTRQKTTSVTIYFNSQPTSHKFTSANNNEHNKNNNRHYRHRQTETPTLYTAINVILPNNHQYSILPTSNWGRDTLHTWSKNVSTCQEHRVASEVLPFIGSQCGRVCHQLCATTATQRTSLCNRWMPMF